MRVYVYVPVWIHIVLIMNSSLCKSGAEAFKTNTETETVAGFQDQRRFCGYVTEQQNNVADVHGAFTDSSECWKSKLVPKGVFKYFKREEMHCKTLYAIWHQFVNPTTCDTSQTALLILHSVSGVF